MLRRFTLSLIFALVAICSFNTANAAFPTEKNSNTVAASTSVQTSDEAFSSNLSKKEFKKEARQLSKKGITASGGKSRIVAALLAIFLGSLGIHSFYMGMTKKGFLQLGLTILGIVLLAVGLSGYVSGIDSFPILGVIGYLLVLGVGIWALVDFVRILTGSLEPEEGFVD